MCKSQISVPRKHHWMKSECFFYSFTPKWQHTRKTRALPAYYILQGLEMGLLFLLRGHESASLNFHIVAWTLGNQETITYFLYVKQVLKNYLLGWRVSPQTLMSIPSSLQKAFECVLIWKQGHCRSHPVRTRSSRGWVLAPVWLMFLGEEGNFKPKSPKASICWQRWRLESWVWEPRNTRTAILWGEVAQKMSFADISQ